MVSARTGRLALILAGFTFLSACVEGQNFNLLGGGNSTDEGGNILPAGASVIVEEDVESPEAYQQTDAGLWDGRPSLGGVWVAHGNVVDPERVLIRNEDNGNSIIGALFRRERENPGPKFQVSSDAATELGMLAGAPSNLSVVALRRVETPVEPAAPVLPVVAEATDLNAAAVETIAPSETIQAATLDPSTVDVGSVAAIAASAIEAATANNPSASLPEPATAAETALAATAPPPSTGPLTAITPTVVPSPAPAPVRSASALTKPFVQIGIFAVETNANDTETLLRASGIIPTIKTSTSNGKKYWRVLVGPMGSSADQSSVISKVKGLGFPDAYPVSN